jgi:hypothetical protein
MPRGERFLDFRWPPHSSPNQKTIRTNLYGGLNAFEENHLSNASHLEGFPAMEDSFEDPLRSSFERSIFYFAFCPFIWLRGSDASPDGTLALLSAAA